MATAAQQAHWEKLHTDWVFANQEALKARREVTGAFIECAAGQGPGPTVELITETERLEKLASDAQAIKDAYIREVFRG